eukprot:tig00000073_g1747.t1
MDAIQKVVRAIQTRCKAENVDASETLEDDMSELVVMCVNRLKDVDSPSLASVKLQVEFDAQYSAELGRVEREKTMREKKINAMLSDIASIKARTTTTLTVFAYLVSMSGTAAEGGTVDRAVELEVAAALESVFPKIGLRAFVAMPTDEKKTQLRELASIVLGIRLFNKDIGKGGAGLEEIPALAQEEARAMEGRVRADKEELRAQVLQYLEVVNHGALPEKAMRHLRTELINRRQVGSCLDTVEQDLSGMLSHVDECVAGFDREMAELKALVGSKTSVPKEQVYPKFDSLAHLWHSLSDERQAALEAARAARAADAAAARQLKDFEAAEAAAAGFQALAAGPAQDARTFARAAEEAAASSSSPPPPPPPPPSGPRAPRRPRGAVDRVGGGAGGEEPAAAAAAPAGEPTDEADETGVSSIVREAGAQAAARRPPSRPEEAPAAEAAAEAPAAAAADGEAAAARRSRLLRRRRRRRARRRRLPPRARRRRRKGSQRGSFKAAPASDEAAPAPAEAAPAEAAAERPPSAAAAERPPSAAGRRPLRARASGRTAGVGGGGGGRAPVLGGSGAAGFGRGAACVGRGAAASARRGLRRRGAACVGRGAACVGRGAGGGGGGGDRRVGEERGEGAERGRLAAAEHGGGRQAGDAHRLQAGTPTGSASAAAARPPSGAPSQLGRRRGRGRARGRGGGCGGGGGVGLAPASAVALAAVEAAKPPSAPGSVRSERAGSAAAAAPAAARPPSGAASAGRAPSATGSASGAAAAAGTRARLRRQLRRPHERRGSRLLPGDAGGAGRAADPGTQPGYVKFADAYYAISGEEAIWRFMATPERYVEGVLQAVRRAPELVRLLRLQQRVVGAGLGAGGPAARTSPSRCSLYTWNEWELRRRALQLTNLRYKKDALGADGLQPLPARQRDAALPPKDSGTQTRVDAGTNGPRMHNYIAGLRATRTRRCTSST